MNYKYFSKDLEQGIRDMNDQALGIGIDGVGKGIFI